MKRLALKKLVAVVLVGLIAVQDSQQANAEISDLRIRFKSGCVRENTDGACTIKVAASGSDFDSSDRVTLYASTGPNQPFRRITNHWRQLSSRGTTVTNIKNIPGACFQVRTWTPTDDASVRFVSSRFNRVSLDEQYADDYPRLCKGRNGGVRCSQRHTIATARDQRVISNTICEPLGFADRR